MGRFPRNTSYWFRSKNRKKSSTKDTSQTKRKKNLSFYNSPVSGVLGLSPNVSFNPRVTSTQVKTVKKQPFQKSNYWQVRNRSEDTHSNHKRKFYPNQEANNSEECSFYIDTHGSDVSDSVAEMPSNQAETSKKNKLSAYANKNIKLPNANRCKAENADAAITQNSKANYYIKRKRESKDGPLTQSMSFNSTFESSSDSSKNIKPINDNRCKAVHVDAAIMRDSKTNYVKRMREFDDGSLTKSTSSDDSFKFSSHANKNIKPPIGNWYKAENDDAAITRNSQTNYVKKKRESGERPLTQPMSSDDFFERPKIQYSQTNCKKAKQESDSRPLTQIPFNNVLEAPELQDSKTKSAILEGAGNDESPTQNTSFNDSFEIPCGQSCYTDSNHEDITEATLKEITDCFLSDPPPSWPQCPNLVSETTDTKKNQRPDILPPLSPVTCTTENGEEESSAKHQSRIPTDMDHKDNSIIKNDAGEDSGGARVLNSMPSEININGSYFSIGESQQSPVSTFFSQSDDDEVIYSSQNQNTSIEPNMSFLKSKSFTSDRETPSPSIQESLISPDGFKKFCSNLPTVSKPNSHPVVFEHTQPLTYSDQAAVMPITSTQKGNQFVRLNGLNYQNLPYQKESKNEQLQKDNFEFSSQTQPAYPISILNKEVPSNERGPSEQPDELASDNKTSHEQSTKTQKILAPNPLENKPLIHISFNGETFFAHRLEDGQIGILTFVISEIETGKCVKSKEFSTRKPCEVICQEMDQLKDQKLMSNIGPTYGSKESVAVTVERHHKSTSKRRSKAKKDWPSRRVKSRSLCAKEVDHSDPWWHRYYDDLDIDFGNLGRKLKEKQKKKLTEELKT